MTNRLTTALAAVLAATFAAAGSASAQNLVISNVRIITGTGPIIEKGSLVVKDGKIASVGAGPAPAGSLTKGTKRIDGTGKTLIAGYIDDHRHLLQIRNGDTATYFSTVAPKEMMQLLESGVTTVQEGGGNGPSSIELRNRINSGQIKGPRIIASWSVPTARMKDEASVRAEVDKAKAAGADSIGEVHYPDKTWPYDPTPQETANLKAGIDEARKMDLPFQVHAVSVPAILGAMKIGGVKMVHSLDYGWMTDAEAKQVAAGHVWVSSCSGFGAPVFNVFNKDNKPTFRDGKPWPEGIIEGEGRGREAGYKVINGRTMFDNGVEYGYCTDTTYDAKAAIAHELKSLSLVFSPIDLITVMGKYSADFIDMGDKIGTLEPGKYADVLVLSGDPRNGFWYFLDPLVVIKGGVVMVDNRGKPGAGQPLAPAY